MVQEGLYSPSSTAARIPECQSLSDVLQYWNEGAPEKGLTVPLKLWAEKYTTQEMRSEAVKFGKIRFIFEEFSQHCGGDMDVFEAKFPNLSTKYTKLSKAVLEARKERGDSKPRASRIRK